MSFSVPRFPAMPFHRCNIEHWTYRYVRATYRPLSVDEPPDNPSKAIDMEPPLIRTHIIGLPQEESATTSQTPPTFSGVRLGNTELHCSNHAGVTNQSIRHGNGATQAPRSSGEEPSDCAPQYISRPETCHGGHSGTVNWTHPEGPFPFPKESQQEPGQLPTLIPLQMGLSPRRASQGIPDSPASPHPSPPQSPRTSPSIPPDSPPPSPPRLPAPHRHAPPPTEAIFVLPATESPPAHEPQLAPEPQPAPDSQPEPEPQPAPESEQPLEIPQFSITVINGQSSRTITSGPRDPGAPSRSRRTIRIINGRVNGGPLVTTTIRSEVVGGDAPQRPVPDVPSLQSVIDRLGERLNSPLRNRSRSRSRGRPQTFTEQEPFVYEHSRDPENPRKHLTGVPSWGIKAEDRRGMCNVCFEDNSHLQIKCKRCAK